MKDFKFKGREFKHDMVFNELLNVYEIVELTTGKVKANSSDSLYASKLLYEFDGIFVCEPIQLDLFNGDTYI